MRHLTFFPLLSDRVESPFRAFFHLFDACLKRPPSTTVPAGRPVRPLLFLPFSATSFPSSSSRPFFGGDNLAYTPPLREAFRHRPGPFPFAQITSTTLSRNQTPNLPTCNGFLPLPPDVSLTSIAAEYSPYQPAFLSCENSGFCSVDGFF